MESDLLARKDIRGGSNMRDTIYICSVCNKSFRFKGSSNHVVFCPKCHKSRYVMEDLKPRKKDKNQNLK